MNRKTLRLPSWSSPRKSDVEARQAVAPFSLWSFPPSTPFSALWLLKPIRDRFSHLSLEITFNPEDDFWTFDFEVILCPNNPLSLELRLVLLSQVSRIFSICSAFTSSVWDFDFSLLVRGTLGRIIYCYVDHLQYVTYRRRPTYHFSFSKTSFQEFKNLNIDPWLLKERT